ncbi:MAG: hypothetical protein Q8928_10380 [Bacteroidota bacterium]|nr:hypothetical protein [Bacteroidota bacterium]
MLNTKLKAFTVTELLVAMILTGIVIFAAMRLFLNYEGLVRFKNKRMETGKEVLQFYRVFSKEFEEAYTVKVTGRQFSFVKPDKSIIQYNLTEDYIAREVRGQQDTFAIKVNDLKVFKDRVTGWAKSVTLSLLAGADTFPVSLTKQYENAVLMNKDLK